MSRCRAQGPLLVGPSRDTDSPSREEKAASLRGDGRKTDQEEPGKNELNLWRWKRSFQR